MRPTITKEQFEESFRKYYEALCHFAFRYLESESESKELVQQLFVDVWALRNSIVIQHSIKAYLYTSVRNRCITLLKSRHHISSLHNLDESSLPVVTNHSDYDELEAEVMQAIKKLPEKCREIFELSRDEGLKYQQIAHKLGISEKTVENQIGIALRKLRIITRNFLFSIFF